MLYWLYAIGMAQNSSDVQWRWIKRKYQEISQLKIMIGTDVTYCNEKTYLPRVWKSDPWYQSVQKLPWLTYLPNSLTPLLTEYLWECCQKSFHICKTHVDPINTFYDTSTICEEVKSCSLTKFSLFLFNVRFKSSLHILENILLGKVSNIKTWTDSFNLIHFYCIAIQVWGWLLGLLKVEVKVTPLFISESFKNEILLSSCQ